MLPKCWLIIRDDAKRTFEICGQASNTNAFTNNIYGMQRAGMNVSFVTPPIINTNSNKGTVKVNGYTRETGLNERLMEEYRKITRAPFDSFDDE